MPRCQRTFKRIPEPPFSVRARTNSAVWTCPYCSDGETYEAVGDPDLIGYADAAEAIARREFPAAQEPRRSTLLLLGLRPECVLEPDLRRYEVYLQRGSDPLQLRLQVGHELFHRVCSRGTVFHWTHEMLACVFSVRLLRRSGFHDYAIQMDTEYRREADAITRELFLAADLWAGSVYPPGYYGHAYTLGAQLEEAAGWSALTRLAGSKGAGSKTADWHTWVNSLPPQHRDAARDLIADRALAGSPA